MKNLRYYLLIGTTLPFLLFAQERFATRNGHISFKSKTPVENIEADNNKVTSVLDVTTGAMEFAVLIKAFSFEKALMQEHFNENYLESNKFPKSTFKGKMTGLGVDELTKPGTYTVNVAGDLTIHGVTKPVTVVGTLLVGAGGALNAKSEFIVRPEDYDIKIPGLVRKNIAETVTINVDLEFKKM